MLIRPISDIHLEFENYSLPELPTDKETVLVLAGDIGLLAKPYTYKYFIEECSERFRHVLYIPGNHSFYKGEWPYETEKVKKHFYDLPNVSFDNTFVKIIDDVVFICATLWTDFGNGNPLSLLNANNMMNDYKQIRTGPKHEPWQRKLKPEDLYIEHQKHLQFIHGNSNKYQGFKQVIVTHHAPSYHCITEDFKNCSGNEFYASNLDKDILFFNPELYIHGHLHRAKDFYIGDTRIVCNPKGYPKENTGFNDKLIIEV